MGEAHDGDVLWQLLQMTAADLLILDLNMPERNGLEILEIAGKLPHVPQILVLSMYDDVKIVRAAFRAGADGYILKRATILELYRAIEEVMAGEHFEGTGITMLEPDIPAHFEEDEFRDTFVQRYQLTKREVEILKFIAQAKSNKEIAKTLYISDQTVSVHRKNIMRKMSVNNTAALIKLVYDNQLV